MMILAQGHSLQLKQNDTPSFKNNANKVRIHKIRYKLKSETAD